MELTAKEELLIEAVREMDEVPYNVLLWYTAGLERSLEAMKAKGLEDMHGQEYEHKIGIARSWMRQM